MGFTKNSLEKSNNNSAWKLRFFNDSSCGFNKDCTGNSRIAFEITPRFFSGFFHLEKTLKTFLVVLGEFQKESLQESMEELLEESPGRILNGFSGRILRGILGRIPGAILGNTTGEIFKDILG